MAETTLMFPLMIGYKSVFLSFWIRHCIKFNNQIRSIVLTIFSTYLKDPYHKGGVKNVVV